MVAPAIRRAAAVGELARVGAEAVGRYVELVRRAAFRVTDAHHDALRAAGLDDDAIFELTLATAVGAAEERRAAGLAAIDAAVAARGTAAAAVAKRRA